jgi:type IV pilus assembly protein PilV
LLIISEEIVRKNYRSRQSGSTLIEIMVAIVVIAIGLLGLAGLQMAALKYTNGSGQRSEATLAALDLSERIRGNLLAGAGGYTFNANYATSSTAAHVPPNDCSTAPCAAANIAANDIQNWLNNLQRRLVGGAGYVVPLAQLPTPGGTAILTFDITIMWMEQGLATADANCPAAAAAPVGVRCFVFRTTP